MFHTCVQRRAKKNLGTKRPLSETLKKNRLWCAFSAMQCSAAQSMIRRAEIRITQPAAHSMDPAPCLLCSRSFYSLFFSMVTLRCLSVSYP